MRARKVIPRPGLVLHLDSCRLSEYDDDQFLGIQIDADGEQGDNPDLEPQVEPFEALHPYGFISRPLDPDVDGSGRVINAAQCLTFWEESRGYALALHDSRVVPGLAALQPGEGVFYGPASNFFRCHVDGALTAMCTDDGTENGNVIAYEQSPTGGFRMRGPWGKLTHDGLGLHYLHTSGARLDLGAISGLPSPLNALGAYATLKAPVITLEGTAVKVGSGAFEPAAKALTLLAALAPTATADTTLAAALTATAAALASLGAIPTNAAAAAQCTAAATALEAAAAAVTTAGAAITGAATTVPAQSVQVA